MATRRSAAATKRGKPANQCDVCPICLEPLLGGGVPVVTCRHGAEAPGHRFHRACLTDLLRRTPDDRCPVCRQPCVGLRAELVAHHLRVRDPDTAFAVLTGGTTADDGPLPPARRERGLADLGRALGVQADDGDARDHGIVVALVLRSVTRGEHPEFLLAVLDALGLDVDSRRYIRGDARGRAFRRTEWSETPLQRLAHRRPPSISPVQRLRAVQLLIALGADPVEAREMNAFGSSGNPLVDLVLDTAVDTARARAVRVSGLGFDEEDIGRMAHIALGGTGRRFQAADATAATPGSEDDSDDSSDSGDDGEGESPALV